MRTGKLLLSAVLLLLSFVSVAQAQNCGSCGSWTCGNVSLSVQVPDKPIYNNTGVPWIPNLNVYTAMLNAAFVDTKFTFSSSNYCGYGAFVTTINGYTPASPKYWALYLNGDRYCTPTGASLTLLKKGDKIQWKVVSGNCGAPDKPKSHHEILRDLHFKATSK